MADEYYDLRSKISLLVCLALGVILLSRQSPAHAEGPWQLFVKRVALPPEPARRPVAHVGIEIGAAKVAGTIQHLFEMPMARVKMMRLGRESFGEMTLAVGATPI